MGQEMSPTRKFQGRKLEFNGCAVCTVQAVGPEGHPAGPGLWGALLREDNPGRSAGVWGMLDLRAPSPHPCLHQLSEQKPPAPGCAGAAAAWQTRPIGGQHPPSAIW